MGGEGGVRTLPCDGGRWHTYDGPGLCAPGVLEPPQTQWWANQGAVPPGPGSPSGQHAISLELPQNPASVPASQVVAVVLMHTPG